MTIGGDREFQRLSVDALDILENKDKEDFKLVMGNIIFLCQIF